MSDILGNGLKILILGSYDKETKNFIKRAKNTLTDTFQRYSCTTLLLENIDMYVSSTSSAHDYWIIFENEENRNTVIILEDKIKPIEFIDYKNQEEFKKRLGKDSSQPIDFKQFRKLSQIEKVQYLDEWADLIFLIREVESTRGGEIVELVYLLFQQSSSKSWRDPNKYEFFYKNDITLSSMIKEIVNFYNIIPKDYLNADDLDNKLIDTVNYHISRLNMLSKRFNQFL